MMLDADMIRF